MTARRTTTTRSRSARCSRARRHAGAGVRAPRARVHPKREQLAQHDAKQRLERGAEQLGASDVGKHVVISASTTEGLAQLAQSEGAKAIVFGSDYRTPPGHAEPGNTAQHLLDGGSVAVAIATAGLRTELDGSIATIAVPISGAINDAARATAHTLADKLGSTVVDEPGGGHIVDLIVVGSQPNAPARHIVLGGDVRGELSRVRSSVLVLPAETPLTL